MTHPIKLWCNNLWMFIHSSLGAWEIYRPAWRMLAASPEVWSWPKITLYPQMRYIDVYSIYPKTSQNIRVQIMFNKRTWWLQVTFHLVRWKLSWVGAYPLAISLYFTNDIGIPTEFPRISFDDFPKALRSWRWAPWPPVPPDWRSITTPRWMVVDLCGFFWTFFSKSSMVYWCWLGMVYWEIWTHWLTWGKWYFVTVEAYSMLVKQRHKPPIWIDCLYHPEKLQNWE